ncbi:FAD-dependent oxidoreductase [Litorihabitans aurantiacus]|uniref:Monooxygenase n=1 Tax=Litorihabitans aurantiacus TaxID=1930061 RepID=A0AA37XH23_9MICO|nr:NAD(P)/FAD-dependent oxidoreductase [Litorihabitans aurantiacus]GMA32827.1 putative monooxygenase [Litorihabitans aurantiacus]
MRRALICGAGVAGLGAALQLKQDGWQVRLFEREPELRTAGVGLNIWPNGVRVLQGLGLGERFLAEAATMNRWWALDSDGAITSDVDVSGWARELGAPITGARRRRLNALLASGLTTEELALGHHVERYEQTDDGVTVHLAGGGTETGDLLLATDGIGSRLRNQMLGGPPVFTDEGYWRWRGVFACADAGVPTDVQADVYGPQGHFGWIPIDDTHAYWYGTLAGHTTLEEVTRTYGGWTRTPVPAIIAASQPDSLIGREIAHYAEHLDRWVDGRVALIGDAAHPMYPGMAQGANQALIDGEVLAACLRETPDVPAALRELERRRTGPAHRMVEYSRLHFDFPTTRTQYASSGTNLQIERYLEAAS